MKIPFNKEEAWSLSFTKIKTYIGNSRWIFRTVFGWDPSENRYLHWERSFILCTKGFEIYIKEQGATGIGISVKKSPCEQSAGT